MTVNRYYHHRFPHHRSSFTSGCSNSSKARDSAFIFNFSDRWNQAASGFVLIDLIGHVSAHGLDLNVPWVGIFWFICKPFLFCETTRQKRGRGRWKRTILIE